MEIQFTNIDNLWVAEFEVTKDFNLHLERDTEGRLDIYQRTAGGDYEYIYDIGYLNRRTVYDNDFQALVYPKWIKIKSAVKPLVATITTDGEVNEVVYQAKDIEITSNGTTKVTADTGYTALGSVNVKVNVPSEGGGESNIEYFRYNSDIEKSLSTFAIAAKLINEDTNSVYIGPYNVMASLMSKADNTKSIAFGVNFKDTMYLKQGDSVHDGTILDGLIQNGLTKEILDAVPRIPKEEFYRLPKSYGIINANPDGNGEEYKDFFEDAWSYLTANAPTNTYIPFVPYPVEYLKIVYPNGGYDEFGSKARAALWDAGESGDGRYYQQIQVDDNMSVFIKNTYSDGTIEYLFELHI